jgi:carboxylesterase
MRFKLKKEEKNSLMVGAEPIFIKKDPQVGILMLHGFSGTCHQFRELGTYLASKGFTVYAPLIAGHGTKPQDLAGTTSQDWKNSVKEAYLDLSQKVKKIIIIGNSFGGNLAFYLAREFNNSFAGIVSLGAPIWLRYQWIIKLRLYTYGLFKKYYRKPRRVYRIDYTDMTDEVTYPVIPTKSIREFFNFLEKETIPNLEKVRVPVLIAHADIDPVVNPQSAAYIYEHLGSKHKIIFWFRSNRHVLTADGKRQELFQKIYDFIKEIT